MQFCRHLICFSHIGRSKMGQKQYTKRIKKHNTFSAPMFTKKTPKRTPKELRSALFFALFQPWMPDGVRNGARAPSGIQKNQKRPKIDARTPKSSLSWYLSGPQQSKNENKQSNPNAKNCKEPGHARRPCRRDA